MGTWYSDCLNDKQAQRRYVVVPLRSFPWRRGSLQPAASRPLGVLYMMISNLFKAGRDHEALTGSRPGRVNAMPCRPLHLVREASRKPGAYGDNKTAAASTSMHAGQI